MNPQSSQLTRDTNLIRCLQRQLEEVFERWSYSEVITPTLVDYAQFERSYTADVQPFKLIDERGEILVLKPDMTTVIARLAATEWTGVERPLRVCYFTRLYRRVAPGGTDPREFFQAGVELLGEGGAPADAEVIALAREALDRVRVGPVRVTLGHTGLLGQLLSLLKLDGEGERHLRAALQQRNLVEARRLMSESSVPEAEVIAELLLTPGTVEEVLNQLGTISNDDALIQQVASTARALRAYGLAQQVQLDLSLVRDLDYYTGIVFELYHATSGAVLGGGGRYDRLVGEFGAAEPATGFALDLAAVAGALQPATTPSQEAPAYLVLTAESTLDRGVACARRLRAQGSRVSLQVANTLPPLEEAQADAGRLGFDRLALVGPGNVESRFVTHAEHRRQAPRDENGALSELGWGTVWEATLREGIH